MACYSYAPTHLHSPPPIPGPCFTVYPHLAVFCCPKANWCVTKVVLKCGIPDQTPNKVDNVASEEVLGTYTPIFLTYLDFVHHPLRAVRQPIKVLQHLLAILPRCATHILVFGSAMANLRWFLNWEKYLPFHSSGADHVLYSSAQWSLRSQEFQNVSGPITSQ